MPRRPTPPLPPVQRLLPPGLDLEAHLAAHPPGFQPFRPDALRHLLHLLVAIPAANRKLAAQLEARLNFVPLGAERLRRWLHNYPLYIAYCLRSGLLETDNHHQAGLKCRWFRLGAAFRQASATGSAGTLVTLREPALLRTLARLRREPLGVSALQRERFAHLLTWLEPARCPLRLDTEAALAHARRRYEQRRLAPDPKAPPLWEPNPPIRYKDPLQQYHYAVAAILRLAELDLHPGFDQQGRLYSALANLGKEFRGYLSVEGHGTLVALDLSNSQPYLINLLLTPGFYLPADEAAPGQLTLAGQGGVPYERLLAKDPAALRRLRRLLPAGGALPPDVVTFRAWTSSGAFYPQLRQALLQAAPACAPPQSEGTLKRLLLALLYARPARRRAGAPPRHPYFAAFAALFPTVHAVCHLFKRRDHTILPCLMQALESHLFLDVIARRLAERQPQPVFTIHDALVVVEAAATTAEQVMRQALRQATGLEPTIKLKRWQLAAGPAGDSASP